MGKVTAWFLDLVGIKGRNGISIASDGNPVPVSISSDMVGGKLPVDIGGAAITNYAQETGGNLAALKTRADLLATEATLQAVKDAILAQLDLATSLWTDDSGAFYVRRDVINQQTGSIAVTFTDPTGNPATPSVGLRPVTDDYETEQALFDATSGGTGYSSGDVLARVLILDTSVSPPTATSVWTNLTTGATIATPTGGTYIETTKNITVASSALPAGAATETTIALVKAKTDNIPAQGQALAAGSLPVVLPAAQVTTLTPPAAITGFSLEATQLLIKALLGAGLPTALRTGRLDAADTYTEMEALADQAGAGAVLTFTFASPVQLVWVRSIGDICRAIIGSQTPSATLGIYCAADEPTPILVNGSVVKVFAPATATKVAVYGSRYS